MHAGPPACILGPRSPTHHGKVSAQPAPTQTKGVVVTGGLLSCPVTYTKLLLLERACNTRGYSPQSRERLGRCVIYDN